MLTALSSKKSQRARGRLGLVAFIALLAFTALIGLSCGPSEKYIEEEIEAARPCKTTEECVDIGGTCPFGCSIALNKREADRIRELIESYDGPHCDYDCLATEGITCEAGLCTTLFTD